MNIDIDLRDPGRLDAPPRGTIRVDAEGRILFHSRRESEIIGPEAPALLGRNFFRDLAPCTLVPESFGRFRRGVLAGNLHTTFEFVFDFDIHPVQVRVTMRESDRPGEYWIIVEPVREAFARSHCSAMAGCIFPMPRHKHS